VVIPQETERSNVSAKYRCHLLRKLQMSLSIGLAVGE
jgi:hypothetical protein